MALSAAEMSARYQESMGTSATTERYKRGVSSVTESPMAKAADRVDDGTYLRKVTEAQGRMSRKLRETPLARYKEAALEKSGRLATGSKAAKSKVDAHFANWASTYQEASQAAAALPPSTDEQSMLARVAAAVRVLKRKAGKEV